MTLNNSSTSRVGFTVVEMCIAVLIVLLLCAIFLPLLTRARYISNKRVCVQNLKQVERLKHAYHDRMRLYAINQWSTNSYEANVAATELHLAVDMLKCPSGGIYTIEGKGTNPACSYYSERNAGYGAIATHRLD